MKNAAPRQHNAAGGGAPEHRRLNQLHVRQRRKRQRRVRTALRLLGVTAGGIAGAYLAFVFLAKVVHPYKLGYEVGRQSDAVRERLDERQRANDRLRERLAFLQSDEGAEVEARRAHWRRPGETVILFRHESAGEPAPSPAPPPAPAIVP